ncbi:ribosome small subunit-dependent GTPase A [Allorhizocola rhizosphaerae]|uniref:ribosome small subunit-dependent GTPase A n=1 Tax=Allorhizocola rhizosphaerae TaxID=1872709 RepID=UPI0014792B9C|nr:ribosome small subunit-dependent GTPase A [Allorhizocola rhizosphaerae]
MRPKHSEAIDGFVTAVDRGRYTVSLDGHEITAMRARELGRKSVVVGDEVALVGDVSGAPGSLARIVRINERRSVLTRTADDDDTTPEGRLERVVVANADQMVIVSALADPPPRTGFIDRCLVAAYAADVDPLLCLTKADLGSPDFVLDYYSTLDLPHVLTAPADSLEALKDALRGKVSVFIGHSGVGKSTLVNRLIPSAGRAVGVVSAVGKGRHTSTSVVALRLPFSKGSWIIDTPGIRSFGLAHVSADDLLHGFSDLVEGTVNCPPHCEHLGGDCALDAFVTDPRRLASYRRLLLSRAGEAE